jgi:hypothetical protein
MIKELVKLANHLDEIGLTKDADLLDKIIYKISQDNFKTNTLSKIALIISDPKNPAKKVDITDQKILSAMAAAGIKVPPAEFVSWITDGIGSKEVRAFFATDLWNNAGVDYIETLQTGGTALEFYRNLVKDLRDFPHNDTKSRGGQIRYNLDHKYANSRARYHPNNFGEKVDKAVTDFMANKAPAIDTGDEILNQTLAKTTAENWRSLPEATKAGIGNISTGLSIMPIIGTGASTFSLATHIYDGKWDLVALDLVGLILSFLIVGKAASFVASNAAKAGFRTRSAWTEPQLYAWTMDTYWAIFSSKVSQVHSEVEARVPKAPWKDRLLLTLNEIKSNKELFDLKAKPMLETEMAKL